MTLLVWEFYGYIKAHAKCSCCGAREKITFHHVDPREKKITMHDAARSGCIHGLISEFRKVIPLCETCHCAVHAGKINGWLKGHFNNGVPSQDWKARDHMPYIEKFFPGLSRSIENPRQIVTRGGGISLNHL